MFTNVWAKDEEGNDEIKKVTMTKTIITSSQRPPWGQRKVAVVKKGTAMRR